MTEFFVQGVCDKETLFVGVAAHSRERVEDWSEYGIQFLKTNDIKKLWWSRKPLKNVLMVGGATLPSSAASSSPVSSLSAKGREGTITEHMRGLEFRKLQLIYQQKI